MFLYGAYCGAYIPGMWIQISHGYPHIEGIVSNMIWTRFHTRSKIENCLAYFRASTTGLKIVISLKLLSTSWHWRNIFFWRLPLSLHIVSRFGDSRARLHFKGLTIEFSFYSLTKKLSSIISFLHLQLKIANLLYL